MNQKEIKTTTLHRSFALAREKVNTSERSIEISFSSEAPVERWFGTEILDHSPAAVRLDRLKNLGPLLVDHDTRDQVGVIEDIKIATDKKGRAVVRFGKSPRAEEIYQDVLDGIRGNVSVGYQIHRMVLEDPSAESEIYRATDWEPLEISIVSVPADCSVGIGRSAEAEHTTIIETIETEPAAPVEDAAPPLEEQRAMSEKIEVTEVDHSKVIAAEQKRSNEIVALAEQHNVDMKKVRAALTDNVDVATFAKQILADQRAKIITADNPNDLNLSEREVQSYSLLRAINASVTGDWSKAGFERECSIAIAGKIGRDARGFYVPLNVQQRTLTSAGAATGAEMVGTDHLAGSFIDALIAESVMGKLGATFLPGLVGDVDIPALGAATFGWLTEDADAADSTPASRSVALSPRTIGGAVPMSRRFIKQSSPAAEMVVERLLRRGAAAAIDQGIIQGSGAAGQPRGITNAVGVNTEVITVAGQPTWADIVNFETAVATDEALAGKLAYLMAHGVKGHCKVTTKDAGSGRFIWEADSVNGYNAVASNLVPANGIIFGNFEDVYVGLWGTLDINPDAATKAASGGIVLRVFQDVDCGFGNAVSFCVNA